MKAVFISYSRDDAEQASRLADKLRGCGLDVWMDTQITAGAAWLQAIFESIAQTPVVLVCLSPKAVSSDWVRREILLAKSRAKHIIPVKIVQFDNDLLRTYPETEWLLGHQWVDVCQDGLERASQTLCQEITRLAAQEQARQQAEQTKARRQRRWRTAAAAALAVLLVLLAFSVGVLALVQRPHRTPVEIINAEAEAVLSKDIAAIETLFAPNAVIHDSLSSQEWADPRAFYESKFESEHHCEIVHTDFQVLKWSNAEAVMTSASHGRWKPDDQPGDCQNAYQNPPGTDKWEFARGWDGTWTVVRFTYNLRAGR